MKNLIYISLALILLYGCESNFDPQLYGTLSPTTFPSNETEYELYMMELYKPFQAKWGYQGAEEWENNFFCPEYGHLVMFDISTDLMPEYTSWGGFWEGFSSCDFSFLSTQGRASHFEKVRFVTRATKIIDDLENADINENKQIQYIAEAKLARGWIMYYLLHIYGPIAVILDPDLVDTDAEADLTRPERGEFTASIESDLRYAADNLEVSADEYGRFNKGAALTVLMRLYMNELDFESAESTGREITELGYSLVDDYASLFEEDTEQNTETIWAVSCTNAGTGGSNFNAFAYYCLPTDYMGDKVQGGWGGDNGVFSLDWDFYDNFEENDTRGELLVAEYTGDDGTERNRDNMNGAVIVKYPDEGGDDNSLQGNDIVVCRYADVLLMLAEAINENNSGPTPEAIGLVNQVRARANATTLSDAETASRDAFRDALFIERGKELYFEGHRKMDLIRMDKITEALDSAGKTAGSPYEVFPVPEYAISNSNGTLTQTDGY